MRKSGTSGWQQAIKDGAIWTEADAREALAACASSGESIVAFARRYGIVAQRLYWWRLRLKKESEKGTRNERAPLIPVTLRSPPVEVLSNHGVVVADGGLRVTVEDTGAVSPAWIAALLQLMREGEA